MPEQGPLVITSKNGIKYAQLASIKFGLSLESKGLRTRGGSALAAAKRLGYKGSRATVLAQVKHDMANLLAIGKAAQHASSN